MLVILMRAKRAEDLLVPATGALPRRGTAEYGGFTVPSFAFDESSPSSRDVHKKSWPCCRRLTAVFPPWNAVPLYPRSRSSGRFAAIRMT